MGQHGATASRALEDRELVDAVIDDYKTAPISEELRATLGFIEKLNATPAEITTEDVDSVRAHGVSDEAIEVAIHMCVNFIVFNKLADAFGWEMLSDDVYDKRAAIALDHGYVIPPAALGVEVSAEC